MGDEGEIFSTLHLVRLIREDLMEKGADLLYALSEDCPECRIEAESLLALAGWTRADFFDGLKAHYA